MRALFALVACIGALAAAAERSGAAQWPVDASSIPSYVITLKRTPRRFKLFMQGAVSKVLPNLEIFDAVDGSKLDPARDDRFSVLARVNFMRKTRRSHTDLVTLGMAGLYISHVEIWKKIVDSGADLAIVLEDDASIEADLLTRMNVVLKDLPPPTDWDVWILGCLTVDKHSPSAAGDLPSNIHEVQEYYGTQAYVITRRGAQRLIAQAYPMAVQVDAYMAQASMLGIIRTLWRTDGYVNVKQLLLAGTTVQQVYCDLCSLPHDYNRVTDVLKWIALGVVIGMLYYRLPKDWASRVPGLNKCCKRKAAARKRSGEDAT